MVHNMDLIKICNCNLKYILYDRNLMYKKKISDSWAIGILVPTMNLHWTNADQWHMQNSKNAFRKICVPQTTVNLPYLNDTTTTFVYFLAIGILKKSNILR